MYIVTILHLLERTCYYSVYTDYVHVPLNGLPVKHIHHWLPTSYCLRKRYFTYVIQTNWWGSRGHLAQQQNP